jgi:hypothetical protein
VGQRIGRGRPDSIGPHGQGIALGRDGREMKLGPFGWVPRGEYEAAVKHASEHGYRI